MSLSCLNLYKQKKWQEFILAVDKVDYKLSAEDKAILDFHKALALTKVGKIDLSLPLFRSILDNHNIDSSYQLKSCVNMGIIGHVKGDFEFTQKCALEYSKIQNFDKAKCDLWLSLENEIQNDSISIDRLVVKYKECTRDELRRLIERVFSSYCIFRKRQNDAAKFLKEIDNGSNEINVNLLLCSFDHYYKVTDLPMLEYLVSRCEPLSQSQPALVGLDYMRLCLLTAKKADIALRLSIARRIIASIDSCAVFNPVEILRACGQVFREAETRDIVLVPSRFGLIGISPVMSALRDRIDRFARSSSPVLIKGESGTGKELTAQALHDAGDRANAPFIPLNCAAIPESVFESQLFGHVAGAFTGANKDQPGLIELAGEGTLFLDEVGELPLGVQAKLLRFLENGEYRRLGSERILRSRARILAATNRSLAGETGFRQDLYHRLGRLEIQLPPLSERREDIRYLARHRIRQLNLHDGSGWKQLDEAAEHRLESLDYPGNVRELFNLVDHAWHEAVQQIGEPEVEHARRRMQEERSRRNGSKDRSLDVQFAAADGWRLDFTSGEVPLRLIQEQAACSAIRQALEHFSGDVDQAASFLEVSRRSIYRYLERERLDHGHNEPESVA